MSVDFANPSVNANRNTIEPKNITKNPMSPTINVPRSSDFFAPYIVPPASIFSNNGQADSIKKCCTF